MTAFGLFVGRHGFKGRAGLLPKGEKAKHDYIKDKKLVRELSLPPITR